MSAITELPKEPRLKEGLVVMPDAETGRGRIVKEPKLRRYYRFDELEGAILDCLDGTHSPLDIQIRLATEFGEEYSLEEIQDFLDSLAERGLLATDGPCLPVHAPSLGREVITALEQGGFRFRRADDPVPPNVDSTRRNLAEAHAFDEAVALLNAGRFQQSLRRFEEILHRNPGNQRAASVRALLLQAGEVRAARDREKAAAGPKQSPLYLRLPLLDPDRFFTAFEPALRFVWTWGFAALYAALVVFAGWTVLSNRTELAASIPDLGSFGWAGGLLLAAVFLTALHECAHGLTCKHFGGKVPEMGFLLIFFFMPALYVDVTDAWLFRTRGRRLLVGLAGPLFDLGAASLAVIVWSISPAGPLQAAAIFCATASTVSVLMNLNPLMRLDGYYILTDLSGIPNLRSTAFRAMSAVLGRRGERTPLGPRARVFVAVYGVLSTLYIALIFGAMLHIATSFSTRVAGLWGPVLLVIALAVLLHRPLGAIARGLGRKLVGMSARQALALAAAGTVFAIVMLMPWSLKIGGPMAVAAEHRVAVRPEVAGQLAELLVREGEEVRAGQVVARLDRNELVAQLQMTEAETARAQAQLSLLIRGPVREEVRKASERVGAAKAEVEHLRSRHERLSKLREEGLVATDLYEEVAKELRVREGSLRAAREEASLVAKGARPEQISAARAELLRLETKAEDTERRLAACELRAPRDGVVVTPHLESRLGDRFNAGAAVLELADASALVAEVIVLESEIGDVALGQPVRLTLAAYPGQRFVGEVLEIAPAADVDDLGRASFRVRCSLSESAVAQLRPGMTGAAKIDAGKRTVAGLAVRRVMRLIDPSLL